MWRLVYRCSSHFSATSRVSLTPTQVKRVKRISYLTTFSSKGHVSMNSRTIKVRNCSQFTTNLNLNMGSKETSSKSSDVTDIQRIHVNKIFKRSTDAVMPRKMIERVLELSEDGETLTVEGRKYALDKNVIVVGFGKAVMGMARSVDDLLGQHIIKGAISVPYGCCELLSCAGKCDQLLAPDSKITVYEGAKNNLPDKESHQAAEAIWDLVKNSNKNNLLLVLVSGGGSALLPLPQPPITLEESAELTNILSTHGATINDLNIVRKQTEVLKGGGLARDAKPCKVICLIISDVIGDKIDIISSGPTVPDPSSPHLCLDIFRRLGVSKLIPKSVNDTLMKKMSEERYTMNSRNTGTSTSENNLQEYSHVQNVIVGSNVIATETALRTANSIDYISAILSSKLDGEARFVGTVFAKLAKYMILCFGYLPSDAGSPDLVAAELEICKYLPKNVLKQMATISDEAHNVGKGVCIITGGETVVNVTGNGRGGRNQEMAVACAMELDNIMPAKLTNAYQVTFLSCGTDGQDGPTPAAGAVVDIQFVQQCRESGYNVAKYLDDNDTFSLLEAVNGGKNLVMTGITGTNVMDIQLLLINPVSHG
ncbi:glycerate kinase-like [Ylistrum balloti]|uniref:glycerate kinase-like n=1 Tax=Ylistrum balloti TaxID=509963 RepID=UPI00290587F4|nr:glycerate kinase-like [Ylistrum balloti]